MTKYDDQENEVYSFHEKLDILERNCVPLFTEIWRISYFERSI